MKKNELGVIDMKALRYSASGAGYNAWTPEAGKGLPDLWFSSYADLVEFATEMGYRLKAI